MKPGTFFYWQRKQNAKELGFRVYGNDDPQPSNPIQAKAVLGA